MTSVLWSDQNEIVIYRTFTDFKKMHVSVKYRGSFVYCSVRRWLLPFNNFFFLFLLYLYFFITETNEESISTRK